MNLGPHSCQALVLNADFRPLSYFPLSLWSWQETVKAVFLERVDIVAQYDEIVRSPRFEMRLPSVISLKRYIPVSRYPAFTRFNVFLRDKFSCQYCDRDFPASDLTFDHVIPRSRGGVPLGPTWWPPAGRAISPRAAGHRRKATSRRAARRAAPRRANCSRTAVPSRPITCMSTGAISFTGTASSIPKHPARETGRAA